MKKSDQTKQKILDAARNLVARRGSAGVSTREIADQAGVSEATIFKYYKTKDSLIQALFISMMESTDDEADNAISRIRGDPSYSSREAYMSLLKEKMLIFGKEVRSVQVLFQELLINEDARRLFCEKIWNRHLAIINYIIERGKEDRVFVDVDTFYIRKLLYSGFCYTHSYEPKLDPDAASHPFPEQFDQIFYLIERAILRDPPESEDAQPTAK